MNPLAHLDIDFAAEPAGPGRLARRVAVALAVMAALGIAAVIWLSTENLICSLLPYQSER